MNQPWNGDSLFQGRRNLELDMAAMNSFRFAEAASRDGISITSDELQQRVEFYKKLYSGQKVDADKVQKILLAEKYLESNGIHLVSNEVSGNPEEVPEPGQLRDPGDLDLAKKITHLHMLLASPDIQAKGEKLEEKFQVQMASNLSPPAQWSPENLQISGTPTECLAWSRQNCLVSLREYNAACVHYLMPQSMLLDSAKSILLKRYLVEKAYAMEARKSGLESKADSFANRIRHEEEDSRWTRSVSAFGMQVSDNPSLQATYSRYYATCFAPREDSVVAFIGSSDSAYLDLLYREFDLWARERGLNGKSEKQDVREPPGPWIYSSGQNLPKDIITLTKGIRLGMSCAPTRTSRGFFLVRLIRSVHKQEVSFEEATPKLIYLATRDRYLEMDSLVETKARKYYAENHDEFTIPDTIALRAWLIPRLENRLVEKGNIKWRPTVLFDTARFQAIEMSSLGLSSEIRISLQKRARSDSCRNLFGPFHDRYGRWYFQILSRKQSNGVIPYRLARNKILDQLAAPLKEREAGLATEEARSEVVYTIALGQACQSKHLMQKFRNERNRRESKEQSFSEREAIADLATPPPSTRLPAEWPDPDRVMWEAKLDLNRLLK